MNIGDLRIGMRIDEIKTRFFPRDLDRAVDAATLRNLRHFGGLTRKIARQSIVMRKGPSKAGRPPHSHGKQLLKKHIYFGMDASRESVVIGPIMLARKSPYGPTTVPEVTEEGGQVGRRSGGRARSYTYAARPYMGPAFGKAQESLPAIWADSIR